MRGRVVSAAILLGLLVIAGVNTAVALNTSTHAIINEEAAKLSAPNQRGLDQILKDELGFAAGINKLIRGREVFRWLGEGGIREDDGGVLQILQLKSRFFRHFHDPLYQANGSGSGPWTQAGLTFFGQHQSSIHWMQQPNQDAQAPVHVAPLIDIDTCIRPEQQHQHSPQPHYRHRRVANATCFSAGVNRCRSQHDLL